ncbi:HEAT repeat domain-containing protein [Nonomuraea jabiensis]|uniref:HEAT repeat protein n=1 Tax=Nonomuraea jabiensis TaxID=882448 RepID=A0A7W9GGU9_9ACTN|nr:HEAT repeat domain-containing protein [Nonomuraea jabiensis]MBB5783532.1 HEAT repeat protein [Nonomuraea jabiensis]
MRSPDPAERKIGCDLLGKVAQAEESLREPVLLAVLEPAAAETDRAVHTSIARALGCTDDDRAVPELLRLAGHPDEDVRFYVAWSLPLDRADDDAVIEALWARVGDQDAEAREEAIAGLARRRDRRVAA